MRIVAILSRYDFQHTGCESQAGSAAILGLIGCTANLGWVRAYCGARIDRVGPDFLDVSISSESLIYPRTLVASNTIGGAAQREVTCADETDCKFGAYEKGRVDPPCHF